MDIRRMRSIGIDERNMLGAEWILPDGELLKTGSPSTRAIPRGYQGSTGSTGVCTKIAVRLHPWPGPAAIPAYGTVPAYMASLADPPALVEDPEI